MTLTPCASEGEIVQRIWTELQRATVDRHHEWRTPVLATICPQGVPQARTVVLRGADANASQLIFFTDSRSHKVTELRAAPAAVFVFWSKRLSWQLRVQVQSQVHIAGARVEEAWARVSQSAAAGDYLAARAPGSALHQAAASEPGPHHLAVVTADVVQMDWLDLAREGHRRARVVGNTLDWLVP